MLCICFPITWPKKFQKNHLLFLIERSIFFVIFFSIFLSKNPCNLLFHIKNRLFLLKDNFLETFAFEVKKRPRSLTTACWKRKTVVYFRHCRCLASHFFLSLLTACLKTRNWAFIRHTVKPETQWAPCLAACRKITVSGFTACR